MMTSKRSVEHTVRDIRRRTRKKYSAEEKIRIVLEGLTRRRQHRRALSSSEGLNPNVYYRWSKDFLEAGKKRLSGDTVREATSDEVKELRAETAALERNLGRSRHGESACSKKACSAMGRTIHEVLQHRIKYEIIQLVQNSESVGSTNA